MKRPYFHNRELELYLGFGAWLLGALLLKDAFDNRGKGKPLGLRVLGAVL